MTPKEYPSKEFLNSVFDYKGGIISYKENYKNKRFAGLRAGRIQKAGYKTYRQLKIKGQLFYEHRVAWIMTNGEIPEGYFIDHINGCGVDNKIENLRVVDVYQNNRNKRRSERGSKSGLTGVTYDKRAGKWKAHIQVGGRHLNLGLFDSPEVAYQRRISANEEFGFDSSHGANSIEGY